jgi:hypothetical protein
MLSHHEVELILREFRDSQAVVIVDWRVPEEPRMFEVFVRSWTSEGFRLRPLTVVTPNQLRDYLVLERRGAMAPMGPIVIEAEGANLPKELDEAFARIEGYNVLRVVGGRLMHGFQDLENLQPAETHGHSTTLRIKGARELPLSQTNLPVTVEAELSNLPGRNLIHVCGENSNALVHGSPMPKPQWFRLSGQGSVSIAININPTFKGDFWDITCSDEKIRVTPTADPKAAFAQRRLNHLGVVFDCTCPSTGECWSLARRDAIGVQTATSSKIKNKDYNESVRIGVVDALRQAISEPIPVHLTWFADGEDQGIGPAPEIESAVIPFGDKGIRMSDKLDEILKGCEYKPGLDIWDPLEDALELAAKPILEQQNTDASILIIGNSPPNLPYRRESPFWKLLNFSGGSRSQLPSGQFHTTARRMDNRFIDLIEKLDQQGIPIVYLFLTHDTCAEWEKNQDDLTLFHHLQNEVQHALRSYVRVIAAPADKDGVVNGIKEAMDHLRTPSVSGVKLRRREIK